jgi:hypothetical protein
VKVVEADAVLDPLLTVAVTCLGTETLVFPTRLGECRLHKDILNYADVNEEDAPRLVET